VALNNGLLISDVSHTRLSPKRHTLRYKVYYLCFPLCSLREISSRLLSVDRFNLFSFFQKDHGFHSSHAENWARDVLSQRGLDKADGEIVLLTLPRLFGYAFNPVNFWFCLDKAGALRAVIAEVNNTFGERHAYVCAHQDQHIIDKDDWLQNEKCFHVSPFLQVRGQYHFRFAYGEERIGVWIDYYDGDEKILLTSVTGKRETLDDKNLLRCFFCYPAITFKVTAMIHYHALKLVMKGIKYRTKPSPPIQDITP
jgi:DUF1365 family protein